MADPVGKTYPPVTYAVGREKVREYANAVGETNPVHLDPEAARAAGHADVVAPPMFAVVYASPAVVPALFDPEVGIDFARMVHGGQEFAWGPLVVAGDEVERTKPFPDPYLTAAARIGVEPAHCVVLEDSHTGTRAGRAAGALVVAVPSLVDITPAEGMRVVRSLEELTPTLLGAWSHAWSPR